MGVLLLMETVFLFAQHGGARGTYYGLGTLDPRQSRTSWPQSFPGPALCAPLPQWTQRSFGFHVFHWCASRTSWCLQAGAPRPHGQGQLSQHRITEVSTSLEPRSHDSWMSEVSHRLMTASRTSVIHGSFPGRDAGPHGPAPLSPRELLK